MNLAYAKTPKGQEEIETRSHGLHPRARRVLILIDGKRRVEELRGLCAVPDLDDTLGVLQQDGYIEPVSAAPAPVPQAAAASATASATASAADPGFRPLPEAPATPELELARNFILNTLKTFTGPYAQLSLMDRAQAAQSHAEMRTLYDDWQRAVGDNPQGLMRLDDLAKRLLAVI